MASRSFSDSHFSSTNWTAIGKIAISELQQPVNTTQFKVIKRWFKKGGVTVKDVSEKTLGNEFSSSFKKVQTGSGVAVADILKGYKGYGIIAQYQRNQPILVVYLNKQTGVIESALLGEFWNPNIKDHQSYRHQSR